ncbi:MULTISPECIES: hypothetical protein [Kordiimonas]|jgi:hypothetical protein|uniref:hypothetical protein n=1 Tax=Kordiimonas TaxID=288021 RepID=UPI00257AACF4|nr:hypothetical protein [Kordiimonas sp. UBA4487]
MMKTGVIICLVLLISSAGRADDLWPNKDGRYKTFIEPIVSTGRLCVDVYRVEKLTNPEGGSQFRVFCMPSKKYIVTILENRVFIKDDGDSESQK